MFSYYVFVYIPLNLATIRAIRTLEPWLKAALVSQMSVQIPFPIKRFGAIRRWTRVHGRPHFHPPPFRRFIGRVLGR